MATMRSDCPHLLCAALRAAITCFVLAAAGCSLVLDFDDLDDSSGSPDASFTGFVDASVIDAGVTDSAVADAALPQPDACTDTVWTPVLAAGSFDNSAANQVWTDSGRFGGNIIGNPGAYSAQSGPNMAYFVWGPPTFGLQSVSQTIALPATTRKLRFSGWRCFISQAPNTETASVDINVRGLDGTLLIPPLSSYDNTQGASICNWSAIPVAESSALDDHAGTDVQFAVEATGSNSQSVFLFDSLKLEAQVCAP